MNCITNGHDNPNVASAPSVFINFPMVHLEIMEQVIDVLNADTDIDAVKACSQTCKAFFLAVKHTFSPVSISILNFLSWTKMTMRKTGQILLATLGG